MNMLEKITMMMQEKNIKLSHVSEGTGIPYTTLDGLFKKGYENMKLPTLKKLADYFDVSMEFLANDEIEDRDYGKISPIFSEDEATVISLWRKLPRDERMRLLGRMEAKAEEKEGEL